MHHSNLVPGVKPSYGKAWQALKAAKEIYKKKPFHIEALRQERYALEDLSKPVIESPPPEELLVNHYKTMLQELSQNVMGIDDNTSDEKEMTYLVLKSQVSDLLRVKDKLESDRQKAAIDKLIDGYRKIAQNHFKDFLHKDQKEKEMADEMPMEMPMPPQMQPQAPMEEGQPMEPNLTMASKKVSLSSEEIEELLEHYGNRICQAISSHHPDAICKVFADNGSIKILGLDDGKELLNIHMNDSLNVNNIVPSSGLAESFPSCSPKFYQRYWKPIVEAVGHFFLDELDSLILPEMSALPDMPNGCGDFDIKGWSPRETKEMPISLSFKEKAPLWILAEGRKLTKTATEYTEEDFLRTQPTRVRCIDQKLKLCGNVGEVVQIIPINAGVGFEVDVNFGRKIVRLSKDQLEIVDEI